MSSFVVEPVIIGYRPDFYSVTETQEYVDLHIVIDGPPAPWGFNVTVSTDSNITSPAIASKHFPQSNSLSTHIVHTSVYTHFLQYSSRR